MKRVLSVLCVAVLMIATLMSFAACGEGTTATTQDLTGEYKLVEIVMNGVDITSNLGSTTITLKIEGDKATMQGMSAITGGEDTQELTVDTEKKVITDGSENGAVPYVLDGKRLILEKSGSKMVFEKQ